MYMYFIEENDNTLSDEARNKCKVSKHFTDLKMSKTGFFEQWSALVLWLANYIGDYSSSNEKVTKESVQAKTETKILQQKTNLPQVERHKD